MTIESGHYCQYCADADGTLHPFGETFERMLQWAKRQEGHADPETARRKTLDFMSTMPAWKDHPELLRQRGAS